MKLYGHRPATEVKGKLFPIGRVSGLRGKQSRQCRRGGKAKKGCPDLDAGNRKASGGAEVIPPQSCPEVDDPGGSNMQTKLRTTSLIFAASLLSAFMIAAVSHAKTRTVKKESHFVGVASWYGLQHQGLKMANGKRFDRRKMTAASWYVPLGTVLRVVNLENGRVVTVTVTDRGPNFRLHRVLDLSEAAARQLGYV
jgi:rare lipoprotein A (peptidoglycan hydrolase)